MPGVEFSHFPALDAGCPDDPEWPEHPKDPDDIEADEIRPEDGAPAGVRVEDLVQAHGEWREDEDGRRTLTRRGVIRIARAICRAERRGVLILPQDA
jgi:hypothetical protein